MCFEYERLFTDDVRHHVWERQPPDGNLVIVVIDDECEEARKKSSDLLDPQKAILPLLRETACQWQETRAIGFFALMENRAGADIVIDRISEWLNGIIDPSTQVYFLVDLVYHGQGYDRITEVPNHTIKRLKTRYPKEHIAYLSRAAAQRANVEDEDEPTILFPGYRAFQKAQQAIYIQQHGKFRSDLMSFLGKGRHEDELITDAIQFYAKPWEENWAGEGWEHDSLEEPDSHQLRALTEWLNVPVDELIFDLTDKTDSAKSLMIWNEDDLWEKENPPWKARDRRRIKGKVLNAALKKLEIPLASPIPDESSITMPCVPCFPFLVSLRSFLWRCQKEEDEIAVDKMCFFQLGGNPQVNIFRLVLPLKDPFMLTKKFFGIGEERAGAFTSALRDVPHCRTDKLMGAEGEGYIRLFKDGTELPVVAVEIAPNQINLIWSVR